MSEHEMPEVGSILWTDLTVEHAETLRDFYRDVVGWRFESVPMEGYADFNMTGPRSGKSAAGICHARGVNQDMPPQWLIYICVQDLEHSLERCAALGGRVLTRIRGSVEQGRFCVIEDPAGAVAALYQPART